MSGKLDTEERNWILSSTQTKTSRAGPEPPERLGENTEGTKRDVDLGNECWICPHRKQRQPSYEQTSRFVSNQKLCAQMGKWLKSKKKQPLGRGGRPERPCCGHEQGHVMDPRASDPWEWWNLLLAHEGRMDVECVQKIWEQLPAPQ